MEIFRNFEKKKMFEIENYLNIKIFYFKYKRVKLKLSMKRLLF
jgi:hypothetical protein